MKKQRLYGQHFLTSKKVAQRIADMAPVQYNDTVFEVGTGHGMLTDMLCPRASRVISVESDYTLYRNAQNNLARHGNLTLVCADAFETSYKFDIFVSNLPYSYSRSAIEWLAGLNFRSGVIMIQKEFAQKLAESGKSRRAVSVIWQEAFKTQERFEVGPYNFEPPPKVHSVVIRFDKTRIIPRHVIQKIHLLFSARRRLVPGIKRRLDDMTNGEIMDYVT